MLLLQLAAAAHACVPSMPAAARGTAMAAMADCAGAPDASPAPLCKAHCEQGSQNVGTPPLHDAQPVAALVAWLDGAAKPALPAGPGAVPTQLRCGASPPGSPPIYLSLLVLRN